MAEYNKLKNCVKYPTSLIIRGEDLLGVELAKSLLEQGGFVILIDNGVSTVEKYLPLIDAYSDNLLLVDYSGLVDLKEDLRRLDYVFYLNHQAGDFSTRISTQEFLQASNYLDAVLDLTAKFDAKFLLTTSIKAHQLLVADKVIDLNYAIDAEARYSVYSELEIQRYAESLVKEYQERVGINARVVRLGILLGKGMEINLDTHLVQMIISALAGRNLMIPGDGLDSDYYIHYLDAAYGIIKAQFTPNTKGQIYTLANEEEVTVLSLAYKLLELIPTAKEIQFDANDNTLPPIKLYKPAQNLMQIGWKPRINLERALKQTIDFIEFRVTEAGGDINVLNRELIPINPVKVAKEKTFKEKVLDFFFIAEATTKQSQAEVNAKAEAAANMNTEGALARLIAERKRQEQARKGNIILANNQLRSAIQPKPKLNALQKVDNALSTALWNFKSNFDGLKNMTVLDFVFLLVGIAIFLGIYFSIISPIFSFAKNLYFINENFNKLQAVTNSQDYVAAGEYTKSIATDLKQAQDRVTDLQGLFKVTGKEDAYKNIQTLLSNGVQFCDGMETVYAGLAPWQSYIANFEPGFMQRLDGNTYISVDGSKDYSPAIKEITSANTDLTLSLATNLKLLPQIEAGLKKMPGNLYEPLQDNFADISKGLQGIDSVAKITPYTPVLLGSDTTRHYLIVLQDNLRYTAGGGEIAGVLMLDVNNGAIKNIKVLNFDKYAAATANFTSAEVSELLISSTSLITTTNGKQRDVALIADSNIQLQHLQKYFEEQLKVSVDLTLTMNLNTLKDLIGTQGINLRSQNLLDTGVNDYIAEKIPASATESSRNDLLLDLTGVVFEQRFNDIGANASLITKTFNDGVANKDIRFYSSNLVLTKLLTESFPITANDDAIYIGANYDQKSVTLNKDALLTLSGTITLQKDGKIKKDLTLVASGFDKLQNLVFCGVRSARELTVTKAATELVTYANSENKSCVILLENSDLKYGISYYNINNKTNVDGSLPFKLELNTSPGIEVLYDIEFVFESGIANITPVKEGFTRQTNSFLYRGNSSGSNLFVFNSN